MSLFEQQDMSPARYALKRAFRPQLVFAVAFVVIVFVVVGKARHAESHEATMQDYPVRYELTLERR